MYFAGIGSRKLPHDIIPIISQAVTLLNEKGWTLRSGAAHGSDITFQRLCKDREIYLPWNGYNNFYDSMNGFYDVTTFNNYGIACEIAERYHPTWDRLSRHAKMLITRNTYQLLGIDLLIPSNAILCWTPDGATNTTTSETGGTGQAIRMANDLNIPVFNFKHPKTLQEFTEWVS